jgi:hypothetical protein
MANQIGDGIRAVSHVTIADLTASGAPEVVADAGPSFFTGDARIFTILLN